MFHEKLRAYSLSAAMAARRLAREKPGNLRALTSKKGSLLSSSIPSIRTPPIGWKTLGLRRGVSSEGFEMPLAIGVIFLIGDTRDSSTRNSAIRFAKRVEARTTPLWFEETPTSLKNIKEMARVAQSHEYPDCGLESGC